jgi:hypothetical protein
MKSLPMVLAALLCLTAGAHAGPNAGGRLFAHDANLLMSQTDGSVSICGQGNVPTYCEAIDAEIDGATSADPAILKIYAVFPSGSSPRLMGLTWGLVYPADLVLTSWGMCSSFELNDTNWPASGSGSSVTWDQVQTGLMTAVYWFAGYNYYGTPTMLYLGPNPSQGGVFGDDSVPALLDPIAGYGAMGFDGPGQDCSWAPPLGACCDRSTGACTMQTEADCPGIYMGDGTVCDPDPCLGGCCPCSYCYITTLEDCVANEGFWLGFGTTCDPNPCMWPPGVGACCVNDVCTFRFDTECEAMGGTFYGECSHCLPSPCATGACCYADQSCAVLPMEECTGVFHQEWGICDPNPCLSTPAERTTWGRIKARFRD